MTEMFEKYAGLDDKTTKTVGFFMHFRVKKELVIYNIEINPNIFILAPNEESVAVDRLKKELQFQKVTSGTYISYKHNNSSTSKSFLDYLDVFQAFALAVRLLTGKKCECPLEVSFNEKVVPTYYYKPFSSFNFGDWYSQSEEQSTINEISEIGILKSLYSRIEMHHPFRQTQEYSRLQNALKFFDKSYSTKWFVLKTTFLFTALESMFSEDSKEIAHKISLRTAYFLHPDNPMERKNIFEFLKKGYDIRSKFLHGNKLDYIKKDRQLAIIRGVEHYSTMFNYPDDLYEIVRRVLYKMITSDTIFKKTFTEEPYNIFLNDILLGI